MAGRGVRILSDLRLFQLSLCDPVGLILYPCPPFVSRKACSINLTLPHSVCNECILKYLKGQQENKELLLCLFNIT